MEAVITIILLALLAYGIYGMIKWKVDNDRGVEDIYRKTMIDAEVEKRVKEELDKRGIRK